VGSVEHVRGQHAHDARVAARAGQDLVIVQQLALHVLCGAARAQSQQEACTLRAHDRSNDTRRADAS